MFILLLPMEALGPARVPQNVMSVNLSSLKRKHWAHNVLHVAIYREKQEKMTNTIKRASKDFSRFKTEDKKLAGCETKILEVRRQRLQGELWRFNINIVSIIPVHL